MLQLIFTTSCGNARRGIDYSFPHFPPYTWTQAGQSSSHLSNLYCNTPNKLLAAAEVEWSGVHQGAGPKWTTLVVPFPLKWEVSFFFSFWITGFYQCPLRSSIPCCSFKVKKKTKCQMSPQLFHFLSSHSLASSRFHIIDLGLTFGLRFGQVECHWSKAICASCQRISRILGSRVPALPTWEP